MNIYDDNSDHHAKRHKQHGKQQVLSEQRKRQRRGRYDFRYEQEEHGLGQENGDAQRDFLLGVGRQVEHQNGQVRYAHARHDQVDGVKQRSPPQGNVEEYVHVRFDATRIVLFVSLGRDAENVPFHAGIVRRQVDAQVDFVVDQLRNVLEVYLRLKYIKLMSDLIPNKF